jgi:hypothetical protein
VMRFCDDADKDAGSKNGGYLTRQATVSFSRRAEFHRISFSQVTALIVTVDSAPYKPRVHSSR